MKTKREFYTELRDRYGITMSSEFHADLDELISDEVYDENMEKLKSIDEFFESEFGEEAE